MSPHLGTPATPRPVRVLIVDDQLLVRQGIRALLALSPAIDVVGEADDGAAALEQVEQLSPDVMLLDLRMPRMSGLEVLQELARPRAVAGRGRRRRPAVLVLTTFDEDGAIFEAMRLGARGYLLKDVSLEQLVDGIETLAAGGRVIQPSLTAGLIDRLNSGALPDATSFESADHPQDLTEREAEVLRLMAAGFSNREIGQMLHLAEGTVKNHVSSVLTKLGVRDRTRAVLRAVELGLITR